jgi:hypothetical protein
MRKVHINSVKNGEIIAKPILADNGSTLLGIGVTLNDRYIERMQLLGIMYL